MFAACVVVSVALAAMAGLSAVTKLTRRPEVVEGIGGLGVPLSWFPWLGAAELAGAVGLVVGLLVAPIGVAAATGLVLYFLGAIGAHVRAEDYRGISRPLPLLVLSIAALVLRLVTS
ncbi:MAG: DoxX family protein [Acidimicrobiia bacterium]